MLAPELSVQIKKFKQLELPYALEVIGERFDGVLDILPSGSFIYGGVVRDLIASMPLEGDLDVALIAEKYQYTYNMLSNSPRWIQIDSPRKHRADYKRPSERVISDVAFFKDIDGVEVQLIMVRESDAAAKYIDGVPVSIVNLAQAVDIRCCGLVMDLNGIAYEIVSDAVSDCISRKLIFNELLDPKMVFKNIVGQRIEKFVKRGWRNEITDLTKFREKENK